MPYTRTRLNPDEGVALTKLALAFCLGRGSLCPCNRSISLQIHQPAVMSELVYYQWRRLRLYLPTIKEPKFHDYSQSAAGGASAGQWRLRVSSVSFQIAHNLLYSDGFLLTPSVLALLGAEGIASLWADRGRILTANNAAFGSGRLNLGKYSEGEAALIRDWISTLTGSRGTIGRGQRTSDAPMLYFDQAATANLLAALENTWHGQAECLAAKFKLPVRVDRRRSRDKARQREEAARQMMGGVDPGAANLNALLQRPSAAL